jgi:hypothetical protein
MKYLLPNGKVQYLLFSPRVTLCTSPHCTEQHAAPELVFNTSWALLRRFAVQEVMMLVGTMINQFPGLKDAPLSMLQQMFSVTSPGSLSSDLLSTIPAEGVRVRDAAWPAAFALSSPARAPRPEPRLACAACGAEASNAVKLVKCSGCRLVVYCGTLCQRRAWPQHKAPCRVAAPVSSQLSFKKFSAAFHSAFTSAAAFKEPEFEGVAFRLTADDEVLCVDLPGGEAAQVAMRNMWEKWHCTDKGEVTALVAQTLPVYLNELRSFLPGRTRMTDRAPDEESADHPFSLMTRPGSYFSSTAQLKSCLADLCLRPFPELCTGARALESSGGPLLFHCLARQVGFGTHMSDGTVLMSPCVLSGVPAERSTALFVAAALTLGGERCPAMLTLGQQEAGGVLCTVTSLLDDDHLFSRLALRITFSDTAAAPRLASPVFIDRLCDAMGDCPPETLVVIPLLVHELIVTRNDCAVGLCAAGNFALYEDLSPHEKTNHLSSVPLQVVPGRMGIVDGQLRAWRPYPLFGGDVGRLSAPLPVPSSTEEVETMLAAIRASPGAGALESRPGAGRGGGRRRRR